MLYLNATQARIEVRTGGVLSAGNFTVGNHTTMREYTIEITPSYVNIPGYSTVVAAPTTSLMSLSIGIVTPSKYMYLDLVDVRQLKL